MRYRIKINGYEDAHGANRQLKGTEWELHQHEKGNRTFINKNKEEMNNKILETKNTRRNYKQAGWRRGSNQQAGGQGRKKKQKEQEKEKRLRKNKQVVRDLSDNMKIISA